MFESSILASKPLHRVPGERIIEAHTKKKVVQGGRILLKRSDAVLGGCPCLFVGLCGAKFGFARAFIGILVCSGCRGGRLYNLSIGCLSHVMLFLHRTAFVLFPLLSFLLCILID
jgi:hypothetical protein